MHNWKQLKDYCADLKMLASEAIRARKNAQDIGTIFPCTYSTGAVVAEHITAPATTAEDKDPVLYVLEGGCGTGSMTRAFIDKLESLGVKYHLDIVDINPELCAYARKKFKDNHHVTVHAMSLTDFTSTHKYHHILSSVPLESLPAALGREIIAKYKSLLREDGTITGVTYGWLNALKKKVLSWCFISEKESKVREANMQLLGALVKKTHGWNFPPFIQVYRTKARS